MPPKSLLPKSEERGKRGSKGHTGGNRKKYIVPNRNGMNQLSKITDGPKKITAVFSNIFRLFHMEILVGATNERGTSKNALSFMARGF